MEKLMKELGFKPLKDPCYPSGGKFIRNMKDCNSFIISVVLSSGSDKRLLYFMRISNNCDEQALEIGSTYSKSTVRQMVKVFEFIGAFPEKSGDI